MAIQPPIVLVTGGAGFIGSNFVLDWMAETGEAVLNLDALTYAGNRENLATLASEPRHRFVHGDILDRPLLDELFARHRPRAVVHFAAESHVDRSIHGPAAFVRTNVEGTFTLLEAARQYWSRLPEVEQRDFRFLHVSTDEVYGSLRPGAPAFTETPAAFARAAEQFFTVEALPATDASHYMKTLSAQQRTAFVAVTRTGAFLLRSKPEPVAAALAELPERQRQLDLSHLHSIILDRLLGLDAEKVREQTNIRYLRDAGEAVEQVRRGEADVVFLTNPVTMEQLREVAFAGDVMPQKSTDFFPKLLSGLTIYALE